MNRRLFIASAILPTIAGCGVLTPHHDVRFKLSVSAVVRGRPFVGSTIYKIRWVDTALLAGFDAMRKWEASRYGDALVVDFKKDGLLFGLWEEFLGIPAGFRGISDEYLPLLPKPELSSSLYKSGEIFEQLKKSQKICTLRPEQRPVFIRFKNIHDIRSAERITADNFSDVYGPDSQLGNTTLEICDAPINRGIENRLPFWEEIGRFKIDQKASPLSLPLYERLLKTNFVIDGIPS
jgi:hypothetical protein